MFRARARAVAAGRRGAAPQQRRGQAARCLAFLAVACGAAAVLGPMLGATFVGGGGFARLDKYGNGGTARMSPRTALTATAVASPARKSNSVQELYNKVRNKLKLPAGTSTKANVLYTYFLRQSAKKKEGNYTQEEIAEYNEEKWVASVKLPDFKGKPEVTGQAAKSQKEAARRAAEAALQNMKIKAALGVASDAEGKKGTKKPSPSAMDPKLVLHNEVRKKNDAPISETVNYTFILQTDGPREKWACKVDLLGLEDKPSFTGPPAKSKAEAKTAAAAALIKDPKMKALLGLPEETVPEPTKKKDTQSAKTAKKKVIEPLPKTVVAKDLEVGQTITGIARAVSKTRSGMHVDIGADVDGWLGFEELKDAGFPSGPPKKGAKYSDLRVVAIEDKMVYLTRRSGDLARPDLHRLPQYNLTLPEIDEDVMSEMKALGTDTWVTGKVMRFVLGEKPHAVVEVNLPSGSSKTAFGIVFRSSMSTDFIKTGVVGGEVKVRMVRVADGKPLRLSMREGGSKTAEAEAGGSASSAEGDTEANMDDTATTTPPPPEEKKGGLLDVLLR